METYDFRKTPMCYKHKVEIFHRIWNFLLLISLHTRQERKKFALSLV